MIDEIDSHLRREVGVLFPVVARGIAVGLARHLDDAGLLEEEHPCARVGCTESAEMGFLTCKTHREVD